MATNSNSDTSPQQSDTIFLSGTTFTVPSHNLRFSIPQAWVEWADQYPDTPNIFLTQEQLHKAKEVEGEWDHEYAIILNEALPFSHCLLHAGSEGWGVDGITYTDLQMRLYILESTVTETESTISQKTSKAIEKVSGQSNPPKVDKLGPWQNLRYNYDLKYEDYGATAEIDFYLQPSGNATLIFVFMHTRQPHLTDEKMSILNSVEFVK